MPRTLSRSMAVAALAVAMSAGAPLSAQRAGGLRAGLRPFPASHAIPASGRAAHDMSSTVAPNHWREGAVVGGLIAAALASWLTPDDSDHRTRTILEVTAIGAVIGGLIGASRRAE